MPDTMEDELERALSEIDTGNRSGRNLKIMRLYLGLDGQEGLSLQQAGEPFGLTRESVRQIKSRFSDAIQEKGPVQLSPALVVSLGHLQEMAPAAASDVEQSLVSKGLIRSGATVAFILHVASLFGLADSAPSLVTHGSASFVVPRDRKSLIKDVVSKANKSVSKNGAVCVRDLAFVTGSEKPGALRFVRAVMNDAGRTKWINDEWLYFNGSGRNCLVRRLQRIFSMVGRAHIDSIQRALKRSMPKAKPLPKFVLRDLVAKDPAFTIDEEGYVQPAPGQTFDPEKLLRKCEREFVEYLAANGRPYAREKELELSIVDSRSDKFSFSMALTTSPLIQKYQGKRGQYVLVGEPLNVAQTAE